MTAPSLLTVDDGVTSVTVKSCSMYSGGVDQRDTESGHGIIEYANGRADRWIRFQARVLSISGMGPAPHALWSLNLGLSPWTVTVTSFENDASLEVWTVVPARPQDSRDVNSGRTSWRIEFRDANPRS